jgi:hypothetical protein
MSGKLKEVIDKLNEANRTIQKQQKEIERLNKLIEIMRKWGTT